MSSEFSHYVASTSRLRAKEEKGVVFGRTFSVAVSRCSNTSIIQIGWHYMHRELRNERLYVSLFGVRTFLGLLTGALPIGKAESMMLKVSLNWERILQ
jgi:hypothetical protein